MGIVGVERDVEEGKQRGGALSTFLALSLSTCFCEVGQSPGRL